MRWRRVPSLLILFGVLVHINDCSLTNAKIEKETLVQQIKDLEQRAAASSLRATAAASDDREKTVTLAVTACILGVEGVTHAGTGARGRAAARATSRGRVNFLTTQG